MSNDYERPRPPRRQPWNAWRRQQPAYTFNDWIVRWDNLWTQITPHVGDEMATTQAPTAETYTRQQSIPLKYPDGVALIGCGGVGSWIGYFLALAGVTKLVLFDGDAVSETNFNRLPYGPAYANKNKAEALAAFIKSVRPNCEIECYPHFSSKFAKAINLQNDVHWLVASTDTHASRKEAFDHATYTGYNYIEAAAEGEFGSIASAPAEWVTEEETKPGYASVPVWVGPAVFAASMCATYILHGNVPYDVLRLGYDPKVPDINFFRNEAAANAAAKEPATVEGAAELTGILEVDHANEDEDESDGTNG